MVTSEVEVEDKVKVWEGVGRRRGVEGIGRVADRPVWPQWQAVAAASSGFNCHRKTRPTNSSAAASR